MRDVIKDVDGVLAQTVVSSSVMLNTLIINDGKCVLLVEYENESHCNVRLIDAMTVDAI